MSKDICIDYVSALCGAGKTYSIVRYAGNLSRSGKNVLIVQPTIALINETMKSEVPHANLPVEPVAITSDNHNTTVSKELLRQLELVDGQRMGRIIFVTHSAFFGLSHAPNAQKWTVIIDEVPKIERHLPLHLADTHELLTKHIKITDQSDHRYWRIEPTGHELVRLAHNENKDQVLTLFEEFSKTITNKNWHVFVRAENYQNMISNGLSPDIPRHLLASAIMSPQVLAHFKQVIIAGACFEESLFYLLWSRWGARHFDVKFRDITDQFNLRYRHHENGDLIDIYYVLDDTFSKNMRDKVVKLQNGDEDRVFDAIIGAARKLIGSEPVAEFFNADITEHHFETAERLPNVSHGLNSFAHLDHCVLLAAHNPPPTHFEFLEYFAKIESDEVHKALSRQNCYQALNRTSVRDPQNRNRKMVVVADFETASFLQGMFTSKDGGRCPRLHHLAVFDSSVEFGKPGRPRKHESSAERSAAYRARKDARDQVIAIREARIDLLEGFEDISKEKKLLFYETARAQMLDRELRNMKLSSCMVHEFQGAVFVSRFDKCGKNIFMTPDQMVGFIGQLSTKQLCKKEDGFLWSPACFVQRPDLETSRGLGNIAFCRNIALDFDGGDLQLEKLVGILPELRIIAYSTWSHSSAKPRFRVFIPTDGIMDVEGYRLITGFLINRLNAAGYWSADEVKRDSSLSRSPKFRGVHGCDIGKLGPSSLFYLPNLGANPAAAFFKDYSGEGRGPLRVRDWLRNAPVPDLSTTYGGLEPPVIKPVSSRATPAMRRFVSALQKQVAHNFKQQQERMIDDAFAEWALNDRPGYRDKGICTLGVALRRAACTPDEVLELLQRAIISSSVRPASRSKLQKKAERLVKMLYRDPPPPLPVGATGNSLLIA